jgi:hypothetical protein
MGNVSLGDYWPYLLLLAFVAMLAWNCRGLLKRPSADESAK